MGNVFVMKKGRHGSVRSKKQIDVSPRTRCVVLKQSWKSEGRFPSSLELPSWNRLHTAVAPFELKIGPNKSHGRAASVKPPPGAKKESRNRKKKEETERRSKKKEERSKKEEERNRKKKEKKKEE